MKKAIVLIERGEDGSYSMYAPDMNNVIIGTGDTVDQAKEDFEEGYREMVETYQEDGVPVPEELKDLEFEYRYDLSAFYEAHPYLNVTQVARYIGINDTLMRQYRRGQYISETQLQRIQEGIRQIGRELVNAELIR